MWALVELLAGGGDRRRASAASLAAGVFIWLSFLAGGRWYVSYYGADKALILAGPKPWVHSVIMETKEHLFFALLLLSTYLPIVVHHPDLATSKSTRTLAGAIAGLSVLLGLTMLLLGTLVGLAARAGTG